MSGEEEDDLDGWDFDPEIARLVSRFLDAAANVQWFAHIGETLTPELRRDAAAYADALGFPEAGLARITNWREAARAAESRDLDAPAFEAEEQLRAALTTAAIDRHGEEPVEVLLTHAAAVLGPIVLEAAQNAVAVWGVKSKSLTNAAAGAGVRACHNAALLLIAGEGDEEHPFAILFRMFEQGRWPVGITGASFNLF